VINKVILVGNVGRDPEVKTSNSGSVVLFSMATSRKWTRDDGERMDETEWHNIAVFGKLADIASRYVTRGRQLYVEGRLHTNSWNDKTTGEKKYRTEIICEKLQLLGQRGEQNGHDRDERERDREWEAAGRGFANQQPRTEFAPEAGSDDDIPF